MVVLRKSPDEKIIPMTSVKSGKGLTVLNDLYQFTIQIVNIHCVGHKENFVLVDTGMPKMSKSLVNAIERNFGSGYQPKAIVLTHGHFDHVGSIIELLKKWDIPVYAHYLEEPFLTGEKAYPTPDASVEGGLLAEISPIYPNESIDISNYLHIIKEGETILELADFNVIHTPGHALGHISLFRENDRTLIAGDAFTLCETRCNDGCFTTKTINQWPTKLFNDRLASSEAFG